MNNHEALGKLENVEFEVLNPRGKIDTKNFKGGIPNDSILS